MSRHYAKGFLCAATLLLASSAVVRAQPAALDVKVEAISHATVSIRFRVEGLSGTTLNWIEYGPTHLMHFRTPQVRTGTNSVYRSISIGGLKPDTRYYFRVVARAENNGDIATWYCASGEAGPGFECDGPDAPARFRTAPVTSAGPILPIPPQQLDTPFPAITGQTFSVSTDDQRRCIGLQQQLNAAAAADPEKNHEVVIPAGATCYGEFVLPRKRGSGVVVVRPSTPLELLPPPGVRIDPSFKPLMATLSVSPDWRSPTLLQRYALTTPLNCEGTCTEGWRLTALEITHPEHTQIPPRHARIVSVTQERAGTLRITLDRELPVEFQQSLSIAGVSGAPQLNRVWPAIAVARDAFTIQTGVSADGASGGYVTQALSLPVDSCGPGPQPVCRTSLPHGLPEHAPASIASITNRVVTTPGVSWPTMATVELEGGSEGARGLWGAVQASGGLRLDGDRQLPDCSGDCGKVRLRPSAQVFGFDAERRLNGSHLYTVLSETEVRLDGIADATAEAAGGFLTLDPNSYPALAIFRSGSRNVVLDRCWVHGRGFPSRLQRALSFSSSDSALVDSVVSNVHSWRPVTSPGGSADYGVHGSLASAAIAIALGDVSRFAFRNNLFENCLGITIYAEQFRASSELTPSDVVIQGNTFRNQEAYRAGSESSDGRYYGIRHAIEFKRAQRVRIEDNVFDGNWADWTPLGPAIGLLTRADGEAVNNRIQDVSIRNNVFRRIATGIQILSTDDRIEQPSLPIARVAIENNLFENVDFYEMRSAPSSVGLLYPSSNFGGQVLYAGGVLEDLTLRYNTVLDNRGRGPAIFWYGGGRGSGVQVTDNVLTHNDDFGFGGLPRAHHAGGYEASPQGGPSDAFRHTFTQTPDPDPRSAFARNLIVPGVRDSSNPAAYDDPQARSNFTKADCESFYAGFAEIECAGSGQAGETARQRIAAVFPDRNDLRQSNGRGADLSGLTALSKTILSPLATILSGAATIAFETGSPESCLVDVSEDEEFATFRRFPDTGGLFHSVLLDGLEPGDYHYRITCASDALFGQISVP